MKEQLLQIINDTASEDPIDGCLMVSSWSFEDLADEIIELLKEQSIEKPEYNGYDLTIDICTSNISFAEMKKRLKEQVIIIEKSKL